MDIIKIYDEKYFNELIFYLKYDKLEYFNRIMTLKNNCYLNLFEIINNKNRIKELKGILKYYAYFIYYYINYEKYKKHYIYYSKKIILNNFFGEYIGYQTDYFYRQLSHNKYKFYLKKINLKYFRSIFREENLICCKSLLIKKYSNKLKKYFLIYFILNKK